MKKLQFLGHCELNIKVPKSAYFSFIFSQYCRIVFKFTLLFSL